MKTRADNNFKHGHVDESIKLLKQLAGGFANMYYDSDYNKLRFAWLVYEFCLSSRNTLFVSYFSKT